MTEAFDSFDEFDEALAAVRNGGEVPVEEEVIAEPVEEVVEEKPKTRGRRKKTQEVVEPVEITEEVAPVEE